MQILLLTILLAVFISFLSSLLESILLSVTPSYVALLRKERPKVGEKLKHLKDRIDRPLTAILTLNTFANTLGATAVGAEVLDLYGNEWVAAASFLMSFIILIFAEILPKTIGATYWKLLAPFTIPLITGLVWLMYPFIQVLEVMSHLIAKKGYHKKSSKKEIIMVAELGANEGTLNKKESRIIKNLLSLDEIFAQDILTPTSVLFAFQKDRTLADIVQQYPAIPFSRIPVFNKGLDDIVGVAHRFKIFENISNGNSQLKIEALAMPVHVVPHSKSVSSLLDEFIKRKEHLFIVVDEYGATLGIITMEDAIETLLGVEIMDEFDSVEDMRKLALEQWKQNRKIKHL